MTKKTIIALPITVAALALIMVSTVFASASKPYGTATTTISGTGGSATSYISKCSCNPVDNYLMAGIEVQYQTGNNYYWDPSSSTYYFDEGTNISSASRTIYHSGITYAEGWFQARCGSGSTSFYRYAYR